MSLNPFAADPALRSRIAALEERTGTALRGDIAGAARDGVLARADVERLVSLHRLAGPEDLMLLALPVAQRLALAPISRFLVGAIGLERETGDLVFGGNLEFPGTHLGYTVHGEGFVFTRAFLRGTTIAILAIGEAHPCAYCRQYIAEFAASRDLLLIDPLGHRLPMAGLYPWPFDPAYLGESGARPGRAHWPDLVLEPHGLPADVAAGLIDRCRHAWAPYSKCPASVVLSLKDGTLVSGCAIESVAFNPTMPPLVAALTDLRGRGRWGGDIASAALATAMGGPVDYGRSTAALLGALAPNAPLSVVGWRPAPRAGG